MTHPLEAAREVGGTLDPAPGLTCRVEVLVERTAVTLAFADGRLVDASEGADPDAEVHLTLAGADAVELLAAGTEPTVAFMRGRLKTAGDPGLTLAVLAATAGEPWRRFAALVTPA